MSLDITRKKGESGRAKVVAQYVARRLQEIVQWRSFDHLSARERGVSLSKYKIDYFACARL